VDVSYENVLKVFNCLLLLLEYIADLGGDIGCRGGGRFGRGRPEEPEEGGAIAAGSLRAIRDGSRLLPVGVDVQLLLLYPFCLEMTYYPFY
jgi:hypothetical protein